MKKDIRAFGYEELQKEVESMGEKAFRAKQIYEWLHVKLADSFGEMTNLSKSLRERLDEEYVILPVDHPSSLLLRRMRRKHIQRQWMRK